MTTIGIVGNGTVGKATGDCYQAMGYEVRRYDVTPGKGTHSLDNVLGCNLVFACLPTPSAPSGAFDTTILDQFFDHVSEYQATHPHHGWVVVKSTTPVGYTAGQASRGVARVCHSPEFLTARTAMTDARHPRVNAIGMPGGWHTWEHPYQIHPLARLYSECFRCKTVCVSSDESELVKLALNSFFAVKVSYWNEIERFCSGRGMDWHKVRDACLADGRVFPLHTAVPGPDGKKGFGGACLPKDLDSLINQILEDGQTPFTMLGAWNTNGQVRKEVG